MSDINVNTIFNRLGTKSFEVAAVADLLIDASSLFVTSATSGGAIKNLGTWMKDFTAVDLTNTQNISALQSQVNNIGQFPLFGVMWWPSRTAIPAGYVAADGQLLNRVSYPTAWTGINAGNVPVASDANWLSTLTERGKYTAGNGTTTFRLPDYNGASSGALGAPFLRGDGALSAAIAGVIQQDAMQPITGFGGSTVSYGYNGAFYAGAARTGLGGGASAVNDLYIDSSRVVRTATETRPINVTGVYIIRLFGAATEVGSINAVQMAAEVANLTIRMAAVETRVTALEKRYVSADTGYVKNNTYSFPHALGAQPLDVKVYAKCVTSEFGYAPGQMINVDAINSSSAATTYGVTAYWDASNINVSIGQAGLTSHNTTTHVAAVLTDANWRLVVVAKPF